MSIALTIEELNTGLKHWLNRLNLGETITLLGPDGTPMAVVVSLKPPPTPRSASEWRGDEWRLTWMAVAEHIDRSWKSDKSALEILAEMRR